MSNENNELRTQKLIEFIDENEKVFEKIVIDNNIDANILQRGLKIVEKFIRDRNLILYGGQAIDFALRLHGKSIYPDDAIPDYDMYSTDSVKDCYDLTEIFEKEGMTTARSVTAMYVRAMKNSVSERRAWIADLSYVPKDIYPHLPTLVYKGMRIIHPHYQMIDMHQSLSAPFQGPSIGEPIFARFKKDIERYNILVEEYPLPKADISKINMKQTEVHIRYISEVLIMFPAYGAMLRKFKEFVKEVQKKYPKQEMPDGLFELKFASGGMAKLTFDTYNAECTIIHCNIKEYLNQVIELSRLTPTHYDAFLNIIPKKTVFKYRDYNFTIYNTDGYLIGRSEFNVDGLNINVASIQYQLKLLLANYIFEKDEQLKMIYLACYHSLIKMINYTEEFFNMVMNEKAFIKNKQFTDAVINNPFMLPVKVYGCKNMSERDKISENIIEKNLGHESEYVPIPKSYQAGEERPKHFDYSESKFFQISGKETRKK